MMSGLPPVLNTGKSWHELAEVMPDPWGIGPNGAGYRRGRDIHRKKKSRPAVAVRALKKTGERFALNHRDPPRDEHVLPPISSTADSDISWYSGVFSLSTMQSIRTIKTRDKLGIRWRESSYDTSQWGDLAQGGLGLSANRAA